MQDAATTPFSLLIGASSLTVPRSGVGRMTAEIIGAVRNRPEIARLGLLLEGGLFEPADLLEPAREAVAPVRPKSLALQAKLLIKDVPGVQAYRRLKQARLRRARWRGLRKAGGGQLVYHEPNMIAEPFDGRKVVTVNDLSWLHHPEYHPKARLTWIERNLERTLADASRFVAISRFSAEAMIRELGVAAAKIDVVPLAASAQFVPVAREPARPALERHGLRDRGYLLSVSTLEPRKNFDRLVAAHAMLPAGLRRSFPLVIVGGAGWGTTLANSVADRARRSGELLLLGHVPDADLSLIYARAAVFAYVSLYEGFGLPVVEAMAAGTPVLASSTTATGETAGEAAELVDPRDVDAIAGALRRLLEDASRRATLRQAGLARAGTFSWERTAGELVGSWRQALR